MRVATCMPVKRGPDRIQLSAGLNRPFKSKGRLYRSARMCQGPSVLLRADRRASRGVRPGCRFGPSQGRDQTGECTGPPSTRSVSWSADGSRIALAAENAVQVVDVASEHSTLVRRGTAWQSGVVAGWVLATGDRRGSRFRVLDWRTGQWQLLCAKGEWIGSPVWSAR
jgi:hypothetical protein